LKKKVKKPKTKKKMLLNPALTIIERNHQRNKLKKSPNKLEKLKLPLKKLPLKLKLRRKLLSKKLSPLLKKT